MSDEYEEEEVYIGKPDFDQAQADEDGNQDQLEVESDE